MKTQKAGYVFARIPVELMQDIDRAAKERKLNRSDFLREGVEILLRIPTRHFWLLKRYAHIKGFLLSGLVREAVERYVSQQHDVLVQETQASSRRTVEIVQGWGKSSARGESGAAMVETLEPSEHKHTRMKPRPPRKFEKVNKGKLPEGNADSARRHDTEK